MTWVWATCAGIGYVLTVWATVSLPIGVDMRPVLVFVRTTRGPYRYIKHPMYLGHWLFIVGCAGLGGGFFVALAVGRLAELLLREWASREV